MSGDTALVLGAGFSRDVGGPLLRELLDPGICLSSRANPEAIETIRRLVVDGSADRDTTGIERAFTRLWEEQYTGRTFSGPNGARAAQDLVAQLQLHLGSVFEGVAFGRQLALSRMYQRFLKTTWGGSRSLTLISFNYDTVAEQALDKAGLSYSYGPERAIRFADRKRRRKLRSSQPDVRILKLHGSVNWGVCQRCDDTSDRRSIINALEEAYVPPPRQRCSFCKRDFLLPGMVPPVASKGASLGPFAELWDLARAALRRSRELLVIGYSLPATDSQARSLLEEINQPGTRPRVTLVCGRNGPSPQLSALFRKPREVREPFEEFVTRAYSRGLPEWMKPGFVE